MTAPSTVKHGLLLAASLWAPAGSAAPSANLYTWISTSTSDLESRDDTNVSIAPTEKHGALINSTDPMSGHYGEDASSRTPYTIVSLACMLLLASMLGRRSSGRQCTEHYLTTYRLSSAAAPPPPSAPDELHSTTCCDALPSLPRLRLLSGHCRKRPRPLKHRYMLLRHHRLSRLLCWE